MGIYLSHLQQVAKMLKNAGKEVPEDETAYQMIANLPSEYDIAVQIYQLKDSDFKPEIVRTALLAEEGRISSRHQEPVEALLSKERRPNAKPPTKEPKKLVCFRCGTPGHFARNCHKPPLPQKKIEPWKERNLKKKPEGGFLAEALVSTTSGTVEFMIDTGATEHFCNDRTLFTDYEDIPTQEAAIAEGTTPIVGRDSGPNRNLERFLYLEDHRTEYDDDFGDFVEQEVESDTVESDLSQSDTSDTTNPDKPNWERVVITRKKGSTKGKKDVYYCPEKGTRLRSRKEVEEYCKKSNLEYNPKDFDFRSESQVGCNESSDTDEPGDSVFEAHCIEVNMKAFLLASFVLSICLAIEAVEHLHENQVNDLENREVVYRVTRGLHGKKKDSECRYKKDGPWGDCDSSSNMQKKTLNLKRGESSCEPTKVISRKCKKACKYDKGEWSDCDLSTNMRTRTDNLKPKSDSTCQPTRIQSKKCKKVCKYNKQGSWSECDSAGKKTKVLALKSGNAQVCEPNKKIEKPCHKGSGHSGHKIISKGRGGDDYDEDD
ncbi:hypothetical protein JTE90_018642 [Oedothorax gibbosus]|uniref:CCHC-type domain-containing protein n=1 Tax=Oedothorax gibbosus TaxID=931172 RepID=A0AAV6UP82_9ARAC|nr:hypothetical protein JTE90_018642 [Oedothorax gibbosus]